jgi:hypothetical protein
LLGSIGLFKAAAWPWSEDDPAAAEDAPRNTADYSTSARIDSDLAPINPSPIDSLRDDATGKSPSGATAGADQHTPAHHDQGRGIARGRPHKPVRDATGHRTS